MSDNDNYANEREFLLAQADEILRRINVSDKEQPICSCHSCHHVNQAISTVVYSAVSAMQAALLSKF